MRYHIAFLIGLLAGPLLTLSLQAQSLVMAQADSLRFLLRANKVDTNRVGALLRLSEYHQRRTLNYQHNLDTALVLVSQAEVLSQQLKFGKGQQEALFQQGKIFIKQEKLTKVKRMLFNVSEVTHIRLLLELGKNKLRPTYSQEAHLDSALWYFSQAEGLSKRLGSQSWQQESQLLNGVAYLYKGDCGRSRTWFRQVIGARQRAGDKAGEMRAWLRWETTQVNEWKCYNSVDSLSQAFVLARQLGDKPKEAFLWLMVGMKHFVKGNHKQAEEEALKALTIQKAIGYMAYNRAFHKLVEENNYLQHVYLFNLLDANVVLADLALITSSNTSKAIYHNLEVTKDLEHSGLREDLDWAYFWLGNSYNELGLYTKGLGYYQQSLAVSHQKGQAVVYVGLIRRMSKSLLQVGKVRQALHFLTDFNNQKLPLNYAERMIISDGFGQCYAALKQYKRAEHYFLEAVTWGKKAGVMEAYTWPHISEYYVATAQYARAVPYLKRLAGIALLLAPSQRQQLYLMQFKVDSAQANFPAALRHFQRYTALKDSLLNETTSKQIAELDIKYQTNQKEQALKLRQKDITLLHEQAINQQTQRNGLIGGTLLLAALLVISFNRYRLKQRSNLLLEVQKRELQAKQIEIHSKNEHLSQFLGEKNSLLAQKNDLLLKQERLLEEKERLLKEIHHRVKNNLQIVMSLLNSQASYLSDESALSAIQQSQHRVQAMALIHQKLYQAEGVARIPMDSYIQEVVAYLHESYKLPQPIQFDLQVEPIELDITQAVPLGLIINEAITNALKYAFPAGRAGRVEVSLSELSQGDYELVIADDGVGLPADFNPARSRSLGMTLMYGFSEQLGGQLHISGQSGLVVRLRFQEQVLPVNT